MGVGDDRQWIGFARLLERAAEKAKLEIKVQPHMLRHACGFKLTNDGTYTRSLQAYLGHKNIQHTVRYTELSPGEPMADWNSALYMKFENERTRAVRDLSLRFRSSSRIGFSTLAVVQATAPNC
jgi:integrase